MNILRVSLFASLFALSLAVLRCNETTDRSDAADGELDAEVDPPGDADAATLNCGDTGVLHKGCCARVTQFHEECGLYELGYDDRPLWCCDGRDYARELTCQDGWWTCPRLADGDEIVHCHMSCGAYEQYWNYANPGAGR